MSYIHRASGPQSRTRRIDNIGHSSMAWRQRRIETQRERRSGRETHKREQVGCGVKGIVCWDLGLYEDVGRYRAGKETKMVWTGMWVWVLNMKVVMMRDNQKKNRRTRYAPANDWATFMGFRNRSPKRTKKKVAKETWYMGWKEVPREDVHAWLENSNLWWTVSSIEVAAESGLPI